MMKYLKITATFLSLLALVTSFTPAFAYLEADDNESEFIPDKNFSDEGCDGVKIAKLKAKIIKARCIETRNLDASCVNIDNLTAKDLTVNEKAYFSQLCTQSFCADRLISNSVDSQSVCTNSLNVAGDSCFSNLNVGAACIGSLVANDVCFTGTTYTSNLINCSKYRATIVYTTTTTYTLGTPLEFDLVLDDPNNNVTTVPYTVYTAPLTGYYIVTVQVDQENLLPNTTNPILGTPIATVQILINGKINRESYAPFLTFLNQQKTTYSALFSLKKGDEVTMVYRVQALDQTTGFGDIQGTVDVLGNGSEENVSVFKISLLNVACSEFPCTPCVQPCTPCTPQTCSTSCSPPTPCAPCEPCTPCACC